MMATKPVVVDQKFLRQIREVVEEVE